MLIYIFVFFFFFFKVIDYVALCSPVIKFKILKCAGYMVFLYHGFYQSRVSLQRIPCDKWEFAVFYDMYMNLSN